MLDRLRGRGVVRRGEYVAGIASRSTCISPCWRNPATAGKRTATTARGRYGRAVRRALLRRHHLHPDHRLVGPPGVLDALELLQGEDFPVRRGSRICSPPAWKTTRREWLDQLGLAGEIVWTPSSRRARSGPGAGASASRSAKTSAGCGHRPARRQSSTRRSRTSCCICSCGAPPSRRISAASRVSRRARRSPCSGSSSGPGS